MKKLVEYYCELPSSFRKPLWRLCHYLIQQFDTNEASVFLNYGYKSKNGTFKDLQLEPKDMADRYGIELYQYVTNDLSFHNAEILEVGCGRGGGASWLTRYRNPKSYIAMDISKSAIDFCKKKHQVSSLSFVQGEAENIPFPNNKFDALINIESARCYGNIAAFFKEVYRVLKPGATFLFADMIKKSDTEKIKQLLLNSNFKMLQIENITENIVLALQADSNSRKNIIDQYVPRFMREAFYEFAGVEGSKRYNNFYENDIQYWCFILKKEN